MIPEGSPEGSHGSLRYMWLLQFSVQRSSARLHILTSLRVFMKTRISGQGWRNGTCVFKKLLYCEPLLYSLKLKLGLNQAVEAECPGFKFWRHHFLTTRYEAIIGCCEWWVMCISAHHSAWWPTKSSIPLMVLGAITLCWGPEKWSNTPQSPSKFLKELDLCPRSVWADN